MKKKYFTQEEKIAANKRNSQKWYEEHKADPEFIKRRQLYQIRYRKNIDALKKDYMREYNTDYIFYVRNVVTGKFEKKIAKTKAQYLDISKKLKSMERRMKYLTDKFGHLKFDKWEKKTKNAK